VAVLEGDGAGDEAAAVIGQHHPHLLAHGTGDLLEEGLVHVRLMTVGEEGAGVQREDQAPAGGIEILPAPLLDADAGLLHLLALASGLLALG